MGDYSWTHAESTDVKTSLKGYFYIAAPTSMAQEASHNGGRGGKIAGSRIPASLLQDSLF